jgi:hypothetical protein
VSLREKRCFLGRRLLRKPPFLLQGQPATLAFLCQGQFSHQDSFLALQGVAYLFSLVSRSSTQTLVRSQTLKCSNPGHVTV